MGDVNYLSTLLVEIPLGIIQGFDMSKQSLILPITFPGKNSGKTEGIDTLGVSTYINIRGRWTGAFTTIQNNISAVNDVMNGLQLNATMLRSPFLSIRDSTNALKAGTFGVTTSVASKKLKNTNALFTTGGHEATDLVKNLRSGSTASVVAVDDNYILSISSDIFTNVGDPYAVTASIGTKVLSLDVRWGLPGLGYCDYALSLLHVNEEGRL